MSGVALAAAGVSQTTEQRGDEQRIDEQRIDQASSASSPLANDGQAFSVAASRAVVLRTTSCGDTSRAFGSGIMVSPGRILTAAHVVAGAGNVVVEVGSWSTDGIVRGYDQQRDLAVVDVNQTLPLSLQAPINFGELDVGEEGRIVKAASSGSTPFAVLDRTVIETDDVRSPTRSRRAGYVIDASTQRGDSGAGIYSADGKLIGIIFAASTASEGRSFVTSSSEISAFLSEVENDAEFRCDPVESKLARVTSSDSPD